MRVAIGAGAPQNPEQWQRSVAFVQEAEKLGAGICFSAEAWGTDAVTPLAYLAGATERIRLASGIMQISSRTPAMTAMTAMTLAAVSGNRFVLGLGASGPQVVEGLHGQPFDHPLGRMRETIEIIRRAWAGDRVAYTGRHFELPRAGGEGKPIRLSQEPNPDIPIYLATLSPKMLELTGELAQGWVGTSFVPEHAGVQVERIARGAERAGRSLDDVDLCAGGEVAFTDDVEGAVRSRKRGLAFTLGAMGSPRTNFYNDAFQRQGYREAAETVRALWVDGRREEAADAVPDELVLLTTMVGTEDMVRERIRAFRKAGITTLRVNPAGRTTDERLITLARAIELAEEVAREQG